MTEDVPKPTARDTPAVGGYGVNPVPTIFVDGIANVARGAGTVRSYLVRIDPQISDGLPPTRPVVAAQIITTNQGFATVALQFWRVLNEMIESGEIQRDLVAQIRAEIEGQPGAAT